MVLYLHWFCSSLLSPQLPVLYTYLLSSYLADVSIVSCCRHSQLLSHCVVYIVSVVSRCLHIFHSRPQLPSNNEHIGGIGKKKSTLSPEVFWSSWRSDAAPSRNSCRASTTDASPPAESYCCAPCGQRRDILQRSGALASGRKRHDCLSSIMPTHGSIKEH